MTDIVEWLRERVATWRKLARHSRAGWIKSANDTADKFEQAAAEIEWLRSECDEAMAARDRAVDDYNTEHERANDFARKVCALTARWDYCR